MCTCICNVYMCVHVHMCMDAHMWVYMFAHRSQRTMLCVLPEVPPAFLVLRQGPSVA